MRYSRSRILFGILLGYFSLTANSCRVVALLKFPRPAYGCRMRSYLDINVAKYMQVRYTDISSVSIGVAPVDVPEAYQAEFGEGSMIRDFLRDSLIEYAKLKNTEHFTVGRGRQELDSNRRYSYDALLKAARDQGYQFLLYGYIGDPSEEREIALYTHLVDTFDETEVWFVRSIFYERSGSEESEKLNGQGKMLLLSKCTVEYLWLEK